MVAYSFNRRFVLPIQVGLGLATTEVQPALPTSSTEWKLPESKRQTIRANRTGKSRHTRPGEIVQLYCGMRTKQCFKIGEAKCKSVERIKIVIAANAIETIAIEDARLVGTFLQDFARADGLR